MSSLSPHTEMWNRSRCVFISMHLLCTSISVHLLYPQSLVASAICSRVLNYFPSETPVRPFLWWWKRWYIVNYVSWDLLENASGSDDSHLCKTVAQVFIHVLSFFNRSKHRFSFFLIKCVTNSGFQKGALYRFLLNNGEEQT